MGTVRYTTINGEVIAEKRSGVRKFYVPDPLGSTVALLDNTQVQTDTFSYWPYGEVKTRTGTTATPFQFVGTWGCYRDATSRTYVRARTLRPDQARWMTKDPIGFQAGDINLYRYVSNQPTCVIDPSGFSTVVIRCSPACNDCASNIISNWWNTSQHWCRHDYTHCTSCCILSRVGGQACAEQWQGLQNLVSPSKWWPWSKSNAFRWQFCHAGIGAAGNSGTSCSDLCNRLYPPDPKKWPAIKNCKEYLDKHRSSDPRKPLESPCRTSGSGTVIA